MKLKQILIIFCVLVLPVLTSAQKTWEKPMNKWSKEEALKILSDSPWAKTYQSSGGSALSDVSQVAREQNQSASSGGSNPRSVARTFGPPPVVVRLHSALPIRQAIIRLQQLGIGYDKMNEEQQKKFDDSVKSFLECAVCKNFYVVSVTKWRDSSQQNTDEGIFQRTKLEEVKGQVKLVNDKEEFRDVHQFTPAARGGDSAAFFFARVDGSGKSLISNESKDLKFVFSNDFLDGRNPYAYLLPRTFEFKVSKMMIGEKIEL